MTQETKDNKATREEPQNGAPGAGANRTLLEKMLAVLEKVEWKPDSTSFPFRVCNACFSFYPNHHEDCELAGVIKEGREMLKRPGHRGD